MKLLVALKGGPTCAQCVSFISSVYIKTCHCLFTTSDIPHRTALVSFALNQLHGMKNR